MNKCANLKWPTSLWQAIRTELEQEKNRIYELIRTYPPPITACDEQFDHLLGERERITRELDRFETVAATSLAHCDPAQLLDEFICSSDYINNEAEQRIRSLLEQADLESGNGH